MKAFGSKRRLYGVCASLILIAGCGGSQQTTTVVPQQYGAAAGGEAGRTPSLAPDASMQDLLYVAHSGGGTVDVYAYPEGTPKGQLPGVHANGLCSDEKGDVFIPEGNDVLEYEHGGTRPVAILRDSLGGAFQYCSVNPVNGNLAVSGGEYPKLGVAIYANAKGTPTVFYAGTNAGYWSSAYDDRGNLFAETFSRVRHRPLSIGLSELPKSAKRFVNLEWNGPQPPRLGAIQWDGRYLAVESPGSGSEPTTLFRYVIGSTRATLASTTVLKDAGNPLQIWIHDGKIVVPNQGLNLPEAGGVVLYSYPDGTSATRIVKDDRQPQAATVSPAAKRKTAVTTYHYDNLRTGWDDNERTLTYKSVNSASFGVLHTVPLDDQVDTQPLIVPDEMTTTGVDPGKHDVVYVATENDTVYAIDGSSGTVLFSQSLGSPVPTPLGCNNNGPNVGIDGTPVIDLSANVMYVIAYTLEGSVPTYRIHELSLANLSDVVPPVVVAASHTLTNGSQFDFNATYQRQRPGLLEANGNIYAGFGSFCDFSASESRGWVLGWAAGSLTPLGANQLNDSLAYSPDDFFLSSVWMSGSGLAADPSGNVYFVTGNSDPSGTTYNGVTNIQESVVKMSADLTQLLSIFTPSDVGSLDAYDADYGSGGVLLLPTKGSSLPLAAAAGKEGTMFLLNQNSLGGFNPSGNNVVAEQSIGGCWCALSYFDAKKSGPQIVASGGNNVSVWEVAGSSSVHLVEAGSSPGLPGGQDPGFFTAVSSAGKKHPIIWALARPDYVPGNVSLFAFKAEPNESTSTLQTLFEGVAGYWASAGGNANIVPVVANGKVYVASYQQLEIFGIGGKAAKPMIPHGLVYRTPRGAPNQLTGLLITARGSNLQLRTRVGKIVVVDASEAIRRERTGDLVKGEPFNVRGKYDASGVMRAVYIVRAKPSQSSWPPDR